MANNNFLSFASANGALVQSDAAYASDAARLLGFQNGIADPAHVNKAWRQGAAGSALAGQVIADHALVDANDDGDIPGLKAKWRIAVAAMMAGVYYGQDTSATTNVIQVALDPAPPTLTSFRSLYVRVANTNTGPVTLALNSLGSKTATRHDGSPLQNGDLPVGQIAHFLYDPNLGQFVLSGLGGAQVPTIAANVTIWVRTDGNDATGDGSANTPAKAYASIAAAFAATRRFATTGDPITIRLGNPGTYTMPGVINRPAGVFTLLGDAANQTAYFLTGSVTSDGFPPLTAYGSYINLIGVSVNNAGTGSDTIGATAGGGINVSYTTFSCVSGNPNYHMGSSGTIAVGPGNVIASSMGGWVKALSGNVTFGSGIVVQFINNPNWSGAGAFADNLGSLTFAGATPAFPGAVTGIRYNVSDNSIIRANGAGPNLYPGSIAGQSFSGGQYV